MSGLNGLEYATCSRHDETYIIYLLNAVIATVKIRNLHGSGVAANSMLPGVAFGTEYHSVAVSRILWCADAFDYAFMALFQGVYS